jgi:hypothetical protein
VLSCRAPPLQAASPKPTDSSTIETGEERKRSTRTQTPLAPAQRRRLPAFAKAAG